MNQATIRMLNKDAIKPDIQTAEAACRDISACLNHLDQFANEYVKCYNEDNVEYKAYVRNAYLDSFYKKWIHLLPNHRALIPTGWAIKVPKGYSMRIYSRSGLALKKGLVVANGVGVVDSDYRQEVFVILRNDSQMVQQITHGERIAQFDFAKDLTDTLNTVIFDEIKDEDWFDSKRIGGFGSTGV